jgi:predicted nucleotidyltransferase
MNLQSSRRRSLRRAIARLVRAFAPERIVLFGSHAKGVAQPGSDVDMLIVADSYVARQLVADNFPPVDVALCSTEDLAEAETARSPFLLSILGSGVTVYRRFYVGYTGVLGRRARLDWMAEAPDTVATSRSNIVAARACRCRVLSYRERDDRYTIAARGSREATIDRERGTSSMR